MSDTVQQIYKAVFTPFGKQQALNAYDGGSPVVITYMGIGDGNGAEYTPEFGQENLKNEWLEIEANSLSRDATNPYWLIVQGFIREDVGGHWIREISLKDEQHRVLAVASWPSTYKPILEEGSAMSSILKFVLEVQDTNVFNLTIDTSLALLTRDEFLLHTDKTQSVHGSTPDAMPNKIVERDELGRASFGKPAMLSHAVRLQELNDILGTIENITDTGKPLAATYEGDGITTEFTFMGLTQRLQSNNSASILVTLDGVEQQWDTDYTVELGVLDKIVFAVPPGDGVAINFRTMVTLTQIPPATLLQPGIVQLATKEEILAGENAQKAITPATLREAGGIGNGGLIGEIFWWPTSQPPNGSLYCNGSAVSREDYYELFALIETTFGSGDGSTTFNIPDMRPANNIANVYPCIRASSEFTPSPPIEPDYFTDLRDGKVYRIVNIGGKVWMAENLNWAGAGVFHGGNNNTAPGNAEPFHKAGRLYTWDEALTVAPPGWHLPTDAEWTALTDAIGGEANAGTLLKSASGWDSNGNGTDDYGFTALPAGYRTTSSTFNYVGTNGFWWSATPTDSTAAYYRSMNYNNSAVGRGSTTKAYSFSVRCVQDTVI